MAQFDIHRLSDGMHVVVLQSDLIDLRESCLVAPMFRKGARAELGRLTPLITHDDKSWLVRVPQLTAVRPATLGPPRGSAAAFRDELFRAIDLLTHGF